MDAVEGSMDGLPKELSEARKRIAGLEGSLAESTAVQARLRHDAERLERSLTGILNAVARMLEVRDPFAVGHSQRVATLACGIAREMGLPETRINGLHIAATVHDLGKIYVPFEILQKPVQLAEVEFRIVKTHPQVGYDILKQVEFDAPVAQIMLQHHERMDGSGYPSGLQGDDIMLEARILGVADVVEAITSPRPHRAASGIDAAIEEIQRNRGRLYDEQVVDACVRTVRQDKLWSN